MTSSPSASFPGTRLRRSRAASWRRRLVRETVLTADDLVLPLFVIEGKGVTQQVGSLPGVARFSIDRAIEIARSAGTMVSFDVNYRSALWAPDVAAEVFRKLACVADVVFAGDDEAALFVGPADDPFELAARISELGPSQVVIKLGERGCAAIIDGTSYSAQAYAVDALDTVGAGDGFVAGYVCEMLGGLPPEGRLDTAVRVGALACLVPGDWEGMPRREELTMLDTREPVKR